MQVHLRQALQGLDPTLAPGVDGLGGQPADTDEHVDGPHHAALGQGRLGDTDHPLLQARSSLRHRPIRLRDRADR